MTSQEKRSYSSNTYELRTLDVDKIRQIQQLRESGQTVWVIVTKRDLQNNLVRTTQDWGIKGAESVIRAQKWVQKLYKSQRLFDDDEADPPRAYLEVDGSSFCIVMQDGNHRVALALDNNIPVGVQLVGVPEAEKKTCGINLLIQSMNSQYRDIL